MKGPIPLTMQYRGFRIQYDGSSFGVYDPEGHLLAALASMEAAQYLVDLWLTEA